MGDRCPLTLSSSIGPLLAPEARNPEYAGPDEPVSLLTSPQVTPAGLGFLPLTREVTPLHSDFRLNDFRLNAASLDFNAAVQRLAKQMGKGPVGKGVAGAMGGDLPDNLPRPSVGGEAATEWDPLSSPAFIFCGAADEPRKALPGVAEEAPPEMLKPECMDSLSESDLALMSPPMGAASEGPVFSQLTPLSDSFGGRYLSAKDDFCSSFMNTPECTPLHMGFLSAPPPEGQCFRFEGAGGPQAALVAPQPPLLLAGVNPVPEQLPSAGSAGHPLLCARPCKYAGKARGCKDGRWCTRCHLCPWRRVAEKQVRSQRGLPPMAAG